MRHNRNWMNPLAVLIMSCFCLKEKSMTVRKDSKGRMLRKGEYIRQSDGRYVYSFTDPFGNRAFIYDKDLAGLREKEKGLMRDQLDGLDVYARGKADLNTAFDRYIKTKCNLRDSTRNGYIYTYDHFVRDSFGLKKIADIKYSDVLHYYLHLLNDEEIALGTLDSVHCVIHPTLQLAVRDDIIRKNPSDGVMAEVSKNTSKSRGIRHALTKQQQKVFMEYVSEHPVYCHWWPVFTVLLGTGMRAGECLGLRWEDILYEDKVISVNHSIAYYPTKGTRSAMMRIHLPKTEAGIRTIPLLSSVKDAFDMIKDEQDEYGMVSPVLDGMTDFIFLNQYGNVINPQTVNRAIKRIVDSYNNEEVLNAKKERREAFILPHFTCHHLRHTFCTRLCEKISNLKIIQAIMGHKDIKTTMDIYAEATEEGKQAAFAELASELEDLF